MCVFTLCYSEVCNREKLSAVQSSFHHFETGNMLEREREREKERENSAATRRY